MLPNGTNSHFKNTELMKIIISEQHTHGDIKDVNLKMYFCVNLYWCLLLQKAGLSSVSIYTLYFVTDTIFNLRIKIFYGHHLLPMATHLLLFPLIPPSLPTQDSSHNFSKDETSECESTYPPQWGQRDIQRGQTGW